MGYDKGSSVLDCLYLDSSSAFGLMQDLAETLGATLTVGTARGSCLYVPL